ncbi:unnamed protein product [Spirodela intermedia]|uniref:Uncharacterized protein n=1 Tax=Spirodela intermedia TaxID=51605 RepID=A0A7I8I914_SPIIN|nr:unnamed protein product [Spirodela intermedia]CAA6654167.1 unnamed protein product [Spirodela intermedia]
MWGPSLDRRMEGRGNSAPDLLPLLPRPPSQSISFSNPWALPLSLSLSL